MRRIERLINLIAALLETERPLTAEEIRARVAGYGGENQEAFRRMFERDKADLRNLGIPLELKKVHPLDEIEGYVIPKERYYLPEIDLEPDELAALHLAARSARGPDAGEGLLKLALEEEGPGPGPNLPVMWSAELAAEQPALGLLYTAVVERQRCSFRYRLAGGDVHERTVEPYALAHRRGHWYLVGRDVGRDAIRTFRVSRVRRPITMVPEPFDVPPDLDLDTYLGGASWEIGDESVRAVVRFDPGMRWWAEQNLQYAERSPGPGGATDVVLQVANQDALAAWVIEFAGSVTIVEPAEARAALLTHLERFS